MYAYTFSHTLTHWPTAGYLEFEVRRGPKTTFCQRWSKCLLANMKHAFVFILFWGFLVINGLMTKKPGPFCPVSFLLFYYSIDLNWGKWNLQNYRCWSLFFRDFFQNMNAYTFSLYVDGFISIYRLIDVNNFVSHLHAYLFHGVRPFGTF